MEEEVHLQYQVPRRELRLGVSRQHGLLENTHTLELKEMRLGP